MRTARRAEIYHVGLRESRFPLPQRRVRYLEGHDANHVGDDRCDETSHGSMMRVPARLFPRRIIWARRNHVSSGGGTRMAARRESSEAIRRSITNGLRSRLLVPHMNGSSLHTRWSTSPRCVQGAASRARLLCSVRIDCLASCPPTRKLGASELLTALHDGDRESGDERYGVYRVPRTE